MWRRRSGGSLAATEAGADEAPLRDELFSVDQLDRHARTLAGRHVVAPRGGELDRLLPRLTANERLLAESYGLIADAVKRGRRVTPAAEWFLDNYHLIEEQIRTARRHLPRGYSRELPRLTNGESPGTPRTYAIALELISHVDGRVDAQSLRAFVASYQSVAPLQLGELWAIPIMLRLGLLENLRRVVARVAAGRRDRETASRWVDRMFETAVRAPADVVLVLAEMARAKPLLTTAFTAEFASRMQNGGPAVVFPLTWLEHRLAEQGQTIEAVLRQASQSQAADQVSIGNSIGSLRFLGATEWRDFVEAMSHVEQVLRSDPSGVYPTMDFGTRDRYRHAVEQIARHCPLPETQVADRAISLAHAAAEPDEPPAAEGRGRGPVAAAFDGSIDAAIPAAARQPTHVGHYLIGDGRGTLEASVGLRLTPMKRLRRLSARAPLGLYVGSVAGLTMAMTAAVLAALPQPRPGPWALAALGTILAVAMSQLAVALVNRAAMGLARPLILPRLDFSTGIPEAHRTIVAVPTIVADAAEVTELLDAMEVRFLSNRDPNLLFALLTDFPDADAMTTPHDAAVLDRARAGVETLNARYPDGGFYLFHRSRQWNPGEGVWMGWERKRGKLEQFNDAVRGQTGGFAEIVGATDRLAGVQYVIALDSDTQLPRDSARQLAGTMAHPLNRPRYDEAAGRVVAGYGILQPRVGISIPSANRSVFARTFAGEPGVDPYTHAVSDLYQDLFGEGSFVGKGIYDLDAVRRAVGHRLPENRVLSHDLLESGYARSGLVSDIVLYEDFPSSYPADAGRRYRWIRGDWQIARWVLPRIPAADGQMAANPTTPLTRWKLVDNLRRSLFPPALLAVLVVGWLLPGVGVAGTLLAVALLLLPAVVACVGTLVRRPADFPWPHHARATARGFGREVLQQAYAMACLPYEAAMSLEAIGRTAMRLLVTRRHLLEWRTSRNAQRTSAQGLLAHYRTMWPAPLAAAATLAGLWQVRPAAIPAAAPVLAMWLVAPAVAAWAGRVIARRGPNLSPEDAAFLNAVARRTWRFFETFVGPDDNYLPPDNFQEDPPNGVAHRTSPTNIGLAMLANLAAYDFGFVPVSQVIDRTTLTLNTLDRLRRHRGHLYNWYDTRTLEPLRPLYISTVDSGNFAGHLLTLAAGLEELAGQRVFPVERVFAGLAATHGELLTAVRESESIQPAAAVAAVSGLGDRLRTPPAEVRASRRLLRETAVAAAHLAASLDAGDGEAAGWARALERQCDQWVEDLHHLAPWLEGPDDASGGDADRSGTPSAPTLRALARMQVSTAAGESPDARTPAHPGDAADPAASGPALRAAVALAAERAARRLSQLHLLAARCRELADADYRFLYDIDRNLLSIGYNVADRALDPGFYDLLASEARLGSYVAIARGQLPQEHWFSLGRSLTATAGHRALLSWSGSMFEYLMPLLCMPTHEHTLLDETCHAVVRRQIEYGREREVPWGISESGYTKIDALRNYQYQAFGVPGLGFKRGLADELVISPYASALALTVAPVAACENLRRLAREGRFQTYGFYEAVDYTPARLPRGLKSAAVRSYMAHHQGMVFLSLAHVLLDQPMQRRFAADPELRAADLLLQERIPTTALVHPHPAEVSHDRGASAEAAQNFRSFSTPNTAVPEVHLLSNGRYHVAVTAAGSGYSRWRDLAVTRWREDATTDPWGTFCYIRDLDTGEFWSAARQPTSRVPDAFDAVFAQGRAEFRRRDGDIETHLEISVSPEDDIELRRISLTNRGRTPRTLELTSYAEVVLATPAADTAHPAFSKLFVRTRILAQRQAILCTRRPRSAEEIPPWVFHLMTVHGPTAAASTFETDRAAFVGRGRTNADPAAMHRDALSDSQGMVLDPIFAVRNTVVVGPDQTVRVHLVTGAAETEPATLALVERYHDRHLADRVFELAWTHSQVVERQLDAADGDVQLFGRLAGSILYANPRLRAPASVIARNHRGQSGLWAYGISGDLPIVLLRVGDASQVRLIRQMVQAHAFWRMHGLAVDLVIWNEDQSGYRQVLHDQVLGVITARAQSHLLDKPGGIFVRRLEQISDEDHVLMQSVARVVISDSAGTLEEQLDRGSVASVPVPRFRPSVQQPPENTAQPASPPHDLAAFNGVGGFTRDGREYVIVTTAEAPTPAPWCNVLANPFFGTVVSESGGGYTWCENAHAMRLSPWNNDPVADPVGEAFYIRDEHSGLYWSPTPLPARGPLPYTTRHGFGYCVFETVQDGIASELRTFVATDAPVKLTTVRLRNGSGRPRRLSVTAYVEWVLGDHRPAHAPHVVTEVDPRTGALLARNPYNVVFADRVAFLDCAETRRTVTGDRGEFLGRNGTSAAPACLHRARLSGRVGAGFDPCAAIQVTIDLADGQEREISFTLGSGRDLPDARNLVARFRGNDAARRTLELVWGSWNRTLGAVYVETPDPAVNFMANGWLIYQVLACRLWARSGYYQSGGAFGFRDQLQDAMALVHAHPAALREQILRCAAHQFVEGDVQHWWHPPEGRGVRTRISDDLLWLPYAACRYVSAVGDTGVLDEKIPFLHARALQPGEESNYDLPGRSDESTSLYDHCLRAIRHALRFGEHGLPLMGGGDWNDGMNLVGLHGKGESVWLAFFLCDVLTQFATLARGRGDAPVVTLCDDEVRKLRENIERHGWDGEWYRRAYFDDGQPLGSAENLECRIDSLPQSWAVLSGVGDPDRARRGMAAVDRQLVDRELRLVRLFDPPFDTSPLDPGYVKGYPPGVRENGGQYTHAAVWVAMAFAAAGDADRAWELLGLISPVGHGDSPAAIATYKVEPYVVAADVYASERHAGRGGWTWYTGSASWMYRLITESLLGLHLEVDRLRLAPCLPPGWAGHKVHYRYRDTVYHLSFHNAGGGSAVTRLTLDGAEQPDGLLRLVDDRQEHNVEIDIGPAPAAGSPTAPVLEPAQSG